MNIDQLLGALMPLFEKKVAWSIEKEQRALTLTERTEERKLDLEYKKLESQITNEKDRMKWEKEKLTTAVKADNDLQTLRNAGMLDLERLKGLNEKDKQKIMEEGANSRAKLNADTETNKAYLTTLGTILGHAQEVSQTGLDGQTKTSKPTAAVGDAARSLMEQTGLARPAATARTRNVAGEAEVAAGVLREHEKNGTPDQARNYLNALPADTRQAALALLNPGNTPSPGMGVAPVAPISGGRTPLPAEDRPQGQPVMDVSRPVVQPAVPSPVALPEKSIAAAGPLTGDGKTAFGGTPGGVLGEIWNRGSMQAAKAIEQRKAEEEKNRALRRARGLTVGGSF